jgi:periplasmic protein TonB
MNPHLTPLQISECFVGGVGPFVEEHARECAECRAKVAFLGDSLYQFRDAVEQWSCQFNHAEYQVVYRTSPARVRYGSPRIAGLSSLAVHGALAAVIVVLGTFQPVQSLVKQRITALELDLRPYLTPQDKTASGGGGGGARQPLDASKGKLPKPALKQFTPPRVDPITDPKLPMVPSIIAPDDVPNIQANNYGDPLGHMGISSNGIGPGGGIGSGYGGGVGPGRGVGVGPGTDGGFSGGAYRIGVGVSAPSVLSKVEPEYSEEARKAKWQGTVVLAVIIDEFGHPRNVTLLRSLGLGLDQKAIEAVSQWRFKPGMKDGKPVPVMATIEVNFRLL